MRWKMKEPSGVLASGCCLLVPVLRAISDIEVMRQQAPDNSQEDSHSLARLLWTEVALLLWPRGPKSSAAGFGGCQLILESAARLQLQQ